MTNKNLLFAGAALLVAGLFTPVVSVPMLGNVNLFNNGSNEVALALVALAAIAALLAGNDRMRDAIWPAAASAGVLLYVFMHLQYTLATMRESLAETLKDNPFAGIAQSALGAFQLQWGWIVLAGGAGLMVYGALKSRREEQEDEGQARDGLAKGLVAASLLILVAAPAWDLYNRYGQAEAAPAAVAALGSSSPQMAPKESATDTADGPTGEEAAYISKNLRLYDLDAKYFDSMLEGRVPGVDFKIKNEGNRTLNEVKVRVVFYDEAGKPIAEEEYFPVLVSDYSYGGTNTPLRPNYIWQQESDKFYTAKNVPTEWKTGKVTAMITDIEFGPAS